MLETLLFKVLNRNGGKLAYYKVLSYNLSGLTGLPGQVFLKLKVDKTY